MEIMLERNFIPYNLMNPEEFVTQINRLVNYGLESLSNQFSQSWALDPDKYRQISSLNQFRRNLKN